MQRCRPNRRKICTFCFRNEKFSVLHDFFKIFLAISDRAYVLETGTITLSGDAQELLNDTRVKKAYLGQ